MIRDPFPRVANFNAQDHDTLVAHPSPFWKFPEAFMCLVGLSRHYHLDEETYPRFVHKNREDMDLFDFIHTPDPTKVRIVERERDKDEPSCWRLPLFDEGVSGHQTKRGDFTRGGQDATIQPIVKAVDTIVEDAVLVQLRRQGKRKSVVRLLAGAVLNAEVGVTGAPTLPFVIASVSTTLEREDEDHTDVVVEPNLQAKVDSLVRSSAPIMMTATTVTSMVDSALVAKEKTVKPSLFSADSSSTGGADPNTGFFYLTGSDFLVGGIRTVFNAESDLQKTYVPQWSMTNGSRLDDGRICREMVDEFAPLKFFASVREIEHDQLFTEFNEAEAAEAILLRVGAFNFETMKKSFRDEVNALKKRNTILAKEQNSLDVKATDLEALAMDKERKLTKLNVQLTAVKSQNDILVDQVHELELFSARIQEKLSSYESLTQHLKEFQDAQLKIVNDKFDKLYADFVDMALHLEEKFYPHLLTTISGRRWLFTHGMELSLVNCMHSPEDLSAHESAVGKAIEKGMQDGLSARIIHSKEGMVLKDVVAHNPSTKANYIFALQQLQNVNFSLLSKLKSNKDASIETVMEFSISPCDVFVPLAEPFSVVVLTGSKGTSNVMPTTADTTTAMSVTLASANTIAPIFVDDYEVMGTNDQAGADGNAKPFPNVDDAELNIP
nr:transposase (putative), gypsy type [Tanacetum cinerariifolium]